LYLEKVFLKGFRNYKEAEASFLKGVNIIYGENAQGKTNLLEAIYILTNGYSYRFCNNNQLINNSMTSFYLKGIFYRLDQEKVEMEVSSSRNDVKILKVNGKRVREMENFLGNINTILYSPDDLKIVQEGPVERRRYINIEISKMRPKYYFYLSNYNKILKQRNYLLKRMKNDFKGSDLIEILDYQLAEFGINIIKERKNFIEKLSRISKDMHHFITGGREVLDIKYKCDLPEPNKEEYIKILSKRRNLDIERGMTSVGPHRDEIIFLINGMDSRFYGSQGQKKTVVITLKLSQMQLFKEETSGYPILLLDDIFSELDEKRRNYILENLCESQVIITDTEPIKVSVKGYDNVRYIKIVDGTIY